MGVIDFSQYLNQAIQAGQVVEGNVVKIIADNGTEIGDAVFKVIEGGNGQASEVAVATQAGASGAVATGLAYLTMSIPTACAAIAPCLGIVAGAGLYNLAPEFWNDVSEALVNAGKTVGGKIVTFWNGENTYYDEEIIEIFKNAFVNAGAFDNGQISDLDFSTVANQPVPVAIGDTAYFLDVLGNTNSRTLNGAQCITAFPYPAISAKRMIFIGARDSSYTGYIRTYTHNDKTVYYRVNSYEYSKNIVSTSPQVNLTVYGKSNPNWVDSVNPDYMGKIAWTMLYGEGSGSDVPLQPGATYPTSDPFPESYPDWYPLTYDPLLPDPSELPNIYPAKYPEIGPDGYPSQDPAQNPDPEPVPEIYPVIIPNFPIPDPGITPEPEPEPDPDPQPEPDPIPDDENPNPGKDPVDPNIPPIPSIPIVVPPLPDTVNSSKLFTVYNPTSSQLDGLGGYLWDSSIIAAIRDIWQDPMDGLISLQQVYVTPVTGSSHNIILGFLDTGVSSAVVTQQFVEVDCGSVTVPENKKNATDYAPYTSLHLYLPFIGIVELDTNECMNATISVKYKVDVYTGTCLATISVDRDKDMPNDPILYTFSGNCSQQLPLTSGNATGMLTALVGAVTAGISVGSGGGLSTLAGAQLLGNSLTHDMMHVSHSGNISANAGIMGQKKPYLIIGRRHCYDANNYNAYYGFPANKTVVLGNHVGFCRVKSAWIKTSALQEEYNQIMDLLENGVFI